MGFDNDLSLEKFIPEGDSVEDIVKRDAAELKEINGSMKAIAKRMIYFHSKFYTENNRDRPFSGRDGYRREFLTGEEPKSCQYAYYEGNYKVLKMPSADGVQDCPFSGCMTHGALDVAVFNTKTKRGLMINTMTIHLATDHGLLEKGNVYGIGAKEFYEHFME